MVNTNILFILASLFLVATTSLAQIRYALDNPFTSLNVFLNIAIFVAFIGVITYYLKTKKKEEESEYKLVGTKGGKARKRGHKRDEVPQ